MLEYPLAWLEKTGIAGSALESACKNILMGIFRRFTHLPYITPFGDVELHPVRRFVALSGLADRLANIRTIAGYGCRNMRTSATLLRSHPL